MAIRRAALLCVLALAGCRFDPYPTLALGSAAPDFSLSGADGRTHALGEYAGSPVLAVVFTCNHCPAAQLYERRIQQLYDDYRGKGVALVAINPDNPAALHASDLAYTDVGDDLADMKTRAVFRHLDYPYLADNPAQAVSRAFGVVATPQIFVFDRDRKLRYEGRIDDNARESLVKTRDARDAIDALVAGRAVAVGRTAAAGCPPTWRQPASGGTAAAAGPVTVEMATADALKKLRANGTDALLIVNFWATWCGPCAVEFPDLVTTHQMYRGRRVQLVSVSENQPEEKALVLEFLKKKQASNRNLLFATPDTYGLQAAFDPLMPAAVPFTLVIAPNGDVVYQELGSLDILKLRRAILANVPDDGEHPGAQAYWTGGHP
jgi:thiol-disulfide isomerase/thioredoxin